MGDAGDADGVYHANFGVRAVKTQLTVDGAGTNPNGSTYTGEVEIKSWSDAFDVARKIGSDETSCTAVGFDGALVINVGKDNSRVPIGVLGLFVPEGDGFVGVWVRAGTQRMGAERWARE